MTMESNASAQAARSRNVESNGFAATTMAGPAGRYFG
jgi:hypothetical protein